MRAWHKPVSVEAIKYDGTPECLDEIKELTRGFGTVIPMYKNCFPALLRNDGNIYIFEKDDYIIMRDTGCVYTCSAESFDRNYETNLEHVKRTKL